MSVPYYPGSRYTTNLGLSLFGMDEVLAENFVILDSAVSGGGGGGGGSTVKVNGSTITNPNFNGTTPAAPLGNTNVIWQFDGSGNVSAYILGAAGGPFVQLNPIADQTITGAHALILGNAGATFEVGTPRLSLDPDVQSELTTYLLLSSDAIAVTTTNGLYTAGSESVAQRTSDGTIDLLNAIGASNFAALISATNETSAFAVGTSSEAFGKPAVGTTMSQFGNPVLIGALGVTSHYGAGIVDQGADFYAQGNFHVSTGTYNKTFGFYSGPQQGGGTVFNAAFYAVDQGTGSNNYGLYLAGALGSSNRFGDRNADDSWSDNQTTVSITRTQSAIGQNPIGLQLNVYSPDFAVASYNGIIIESAVAGAVNSTAIATYCDIIVRANNAATVIDQVTGYYQNTAVNGTGTVTLLEGALFTGLLVNAGATVTNAYNIHINETRSGAGTTVNAHAIHIDDQGTGTNDYAIYSEGGKTVFKSSSAATGVPQSTFEFIGEGSGSVFGSPSLVDIITNDDSPWAFTIRNASAPAGNGFAFYVDNAGTAVIEQNPGTSAAPSLNLRADQSIEVFAGAIRLFGGTLSGPVLNFIGFSSGSAAIQVAAAAGSPNPLVLPTTTGAPGQVLTTDGANPQQLSWTTTSSSPSVVATIDATGQSASIATANIVASATAGVYRVSYYMKITTAGSTSGSVTLTLVYTDRDDSTVVTYVVPTPANATDSSSVVSGTLVLDAKVATAITYATTYASVGGTAMVYKLRLKAEKLF